MRDRITAAVVGLVVAFTSAAHADSVVARVKVQNASTGAMKDVIVRGALPLPVDYDKPIQGLAFRDEGKVLPTQVSVFSTYPGSSEEYPVGRPEIVQLAFRALLSANRFKEFEVVQLDAPPKAGAAAPPGTALSTWLGGKAPVVVEATDCFGNRYTASALDENALIETRQAGPLLTERVYQTVLTPTGEAAPDKPALREFLRVRAYLTTYAGEEFASLALMIHNGSIDHPNGQVYYRGIRVGVAAPVAMRVWEKRLSPAAGAEQEAGDGYTWQPCPAPAADGKVFLMPDKGAAVLRTVVYAPEAKGRAVPFADHSPIFIPTASQALFSWSNYATARYGANNYPVPFTLDKRALPKLLRMSPPFDGWRRLGHAIPAGVRYGGMTGGTGIYYVFGVAAVVTAQSRAIKQHIILADRHWDRHQAHRFYDDGKPYIHSRHVVEVNGRKMVNVPIDRRGWALSDLKWRVKDFKDPEKVPATYLQYARDPACKAQALYVAANDLLSPAAQELDRYMDHDDQHLARVLDAVPAAYLACDPVSRDRLLTLGTQSVARLGIYPNRKKPKSGGRGSLVRVGQYVDANPQVGVGFGRAHGWLTNALCYAFYLSRDRQIRQDCVDVAKVYAHILERAQMPAGNTTIHKPYSKSLAGEYWYVNVWQSVGIMGDGSRCLVGILDSPENRAHAETLERVYRREAKWSATVAWNEAGHGPAPSVALKKKGATDWLPEPYVPVDKVMRGGHYHGSPYIWYYELTGDRQFLDRINEMSGGNVKAHATRILPMWSYCLWFAQGGKIPGRPTVGRGAGED